MNLVIPDGSKRPLYRSVLAMTRSLGREHSVYIASSSRRLQRLQQHLRSRFCAGVSRVADPEADPEAFIRDINLLAHRHRLEALLPYSDEVATVSSWHAQGLDVALPAPPFDTFMRALDKRSAFETARALGIPTPRTLVSDGSGEISEALRDQGIDYPLVVKPRLRGTRGGTRRLIQSEVELADALCEFDEIGDRWPLHAYSSPLVQERVPGSIHDCCVLYQEGCLKAMLTQVRHVTEWNTGGGGVVNITTDVPELKEMSRCLMDEIEWHGPAQVEWIRDERDGAYRLLEINPRFWGTLELSMDAGIDFAELTVRMLAGEKIEDRFDYPVGVRHRWAFPEELMSVIHDEGRRLARIREYLSPGDLLDAQCHFSARLSDPAPDLFRVIETLGWSGARCYGLVKDRLRRLRPGDAPRDRIPDR